MIFRVPALANRLAAFAFEVDRGGVEEHDVQIGEQVAAAREQRLLDKILVGAGSERRGPVLLVFRKVFAQPGHGAVEMMQVQLAGAFDGVVVFPLLGGAVAAGREEAMQHGEEDGALDGKLEAPVLEQGRQDFIDRAVLPEPVEDQRWPDLGAVSGDAVASRMGAEHGKLFREPSEGLNQRVELSVGQQLVEAAEAKQDALFDLAVRPTRYRR